MEAQIAPAPVRWRAINTMAAAVLVQPGRFEIEQVPVPSISEHQMLVRVEGCGVCGSDIPPFEGKPWFEYPMEPGAPGHEGWGTVVRVGQNVRDFGIGDRIGMLSTHAYAEFDVIESGAAVRLPQGLKDTPFPAEPLGCALNIFRRSGIRGGDTVAVIGIGFLGALLTQLATAAAASVIAISRRGFSLDFAKRMGAAHVLKMAECASVVDQVKQFTGGRLCDVVIEATGKQLPLDLAGELTCERGRLIVAGYHQDGPREVNMQLWNWRGLDVINAHERDPTVYRAGMEAAVRTVESGSVDPFALYTHRFELDELGQALEMSRARPAGFMKALIMMP